MNVRSIRNCCNSFFDFPQPTSTVITKFGILAVLGVAFPGYGTAFAAASATYLVFNRPLHSLFQDWVDPEYSEKDRREAHTKGLLSREQIPGLDAEETQGFHQLEVDALRNHNPEACLKFGAVLARGLPLAGRAFENPKLGFHFFTTANNLLQDAALKAVACWSLAMCYHFGIGTGKDDEQAKASFRAIPLPQIMPTIQHQAALQLNDFDKQREAMLTLCRPEDRETLEQDLQAFLDS